MDPMINAVQVMRLYRISTRSCLTYYLPWVMSESDARHYIESLFPDWEIIDLEK